MVMMINEEVKPQHIVVLEQKLAEIQVKKCVLTLIFEVFHR